MKPSLLLISVLLLAGTSSVAASSATCIVCTLLVSVVEQLAISHSWDIQTSVNAFCSDLSGVSTLIPYLCDSLSTSYVQIIQKDFNQTLSPDYTCQNSLALCSPVDGVSCNLWSTWPPAPSSSPSLHHQYHPSHYVQVGEKEHHTEVYIEHLHRALSTLPIFGIKPLTMKMREAKMVKQADEKLLNHVNAVPVADHLPLFDSDNDTYSTYAGLRGSDWRGKDCNDADSNIYPGRLVNNYDGTVDHNCNGIYGIDKSTNKSVEDIFCAKTGQMGVISLGDSATAHFRIPPDWLHAATLNNQTFDNLLSVLEDEGDWPQCSLSTGHAPDSACPPSLLPMSSIYQKMRELNQCNHRDYANIGVNGARVTSMTPDGDIIITMMERERDQPALVIYALIGNDVCNHNHDFNHMTSPTDFYNSVLAGMTYLDTKLPPGSFVLTMGLADGRLLFNSMKDQIHPIGVSYPDLYNYLNCMETSPCWGWMNSNETVRNMTTAHAELLNAQYTQIINNNKFKNFELAYFEPDWAAMFQQWEQEGNSASDLIEPTDGFHPSQTGMMLIGELMWDFLSNNYPQALSPQNENNDNISLFFGDQGGY